MCHTRRWTHTCRACHDGDPHRVAHANSAKRTVATLRHVNICHDILYIRAPTHAPFLHAPANNQIRMSQQPQFHLPMSHPPITHLGVLSTGSPSTMRPGFRLVSTDDQCTGTTWPPPAAILMQYVMKSSYRRAECRKAYCGAMNSRRRRGEGAWKFHSPSLASVARLGEWSLASRVARPGEVRRGQARSGQARSGQVRSGQARR